MRVFVAGATGVLGRQLLPMLVSAGHAVWGLTQTPNKVQLIRDAGAEPIVADALDTNSIIAAVTRTAPEVVLHEMTALSAFGSLRKFDQEFAMTNRLRTEGTRNLLRAAIATGARRFIAQSFAGWPFARQGGPIKTEDGPLDPSPPKPARRTLDAIRELESLVISARELDGLILRYGFFYGPGTSLGHGGATLAAIQRRQIPIVGGGTGVWSFIHIRDAAEATLIAVERGAPGIYNIVDDDPASVSEWLPALASAIGAKRPYRIPAWIGRLTMGEQGVVMMTESRGASNTKAEHEFGWRPAFASWREGFRLGLDQSRVSRPVPVVNEARSSSCEASRLSQSS